MSDDYPSDEVANIMNILGNSLRVDILKLVYAAPRSFTDLMKHLSLESTSKLTFHLSKMETLIEKRKDDGYYELTEEGTKAYQLIINFEKNMLPPLSIVSENREKNLQISPKKIPYYEKNPIPFIILFTILSIIPLFLGSLFLATIIGSSAFFIYLFIPIIGILLVFLFAYILHIDFIDAIYCSIIVLTIFLFFRFPFIEIPFVSMLSASLLDPHEIGQNKSEIAFIIFYYSILALCIAIYKYSANFFNWQWPNTSTNVLKADNYLKSKDFKLLAIIIFVFSLLLIFVPPIQFKLYSNYTLVSSSYVEYTLQPIFMYIAPYPLIAYFIYIGTKKIQMTNLPRSFQYIFIPILFIIIPFGELYLSIGYGIDIFSFIGLGYNTNNFNLSLTSTIPGSENSPKLFFLMQFIVFFMRILGIIILYLLIAELYKRGENHISSNDINKTSLNKKNKWQSTLTSVLIYSILIPFFIFFPL